jgi:hypothetical protein
MQKRYKKRSELTEKTNMGYPTLADELNIETVNDQLAKVPGFEHMLTYGSKKPRFIDGGGNETLRIESINESVSRITNGMQGLFETRDFQKKKINENELFEAKKSSKKLDAEINDAYKKYGDRVEISMMDIPKIFRAGEEADAAGESIDDAVKAAIAKYRKN